MTKRLRILALGMMIVVLLVAFTGCSEQLGSVKDAIMGVKDKVVSILTPYLPACEHEGGEASCTEQAVCVKCGESYGDVLGHDIVVDEAVEPDCENTGLTEGKHCSRCDYTSGAEVVDALGHNVVVDAAVPATCYSTGLTEGKHCDRCEEVIVAQTETTMIPHTYDEEGFDETCNAEGCTHVRTCAHDGEKTVVAGKAPTCTVPGLTDGETCAICGDVTKAQEVIDALGHDMAEATCTAPATCKRGCGHTVGTSKGHSYDNGVVTTAPTCTDKGVKTYTCSACGDSYTEEVPATGHSYDAGVVTTAPTCTDKGVKTFTCSCGDSYTEDVKATGHSYTPVVTAPTCTVDGYITYTCSCGDSYTTPGTAASGHAWGNWIVDKEATEEAEGAKHRDCANCDEVETAIIPELSHVHSYTEEVVAPTCTEKGYTKHTCRCGDSYNTDEIDALDHDYIVVTVDPTCTEKGSTTTTCSRCDYKNVEFITSTGHNYNAVVTAPNCNDKGYTTHTCHCGDSYVDTYVDALGHKDEDHNHACDNGCNVYQGTHADADNDGDHVCDYCGGAVVGESCTAGTPTKENTVEATCGVAGSYDLVTRCEECNTVLDTQHHTISATGNHAWGTWTETKAPTCTVDGSKTRECVVCEATETAVVPATNVHNYTTEVERVDATCGADGYVINKCATCEKTEETTLNATGEHAWGDWVVTLDPTCTDDGSKTKTCSVCGATETGVAPATGHVNTTTETVDATCSVAGSTTVTCACGEVVSTTTIPATNVHNYTTEVERVDATCGADGYVINKCATCEKTEKTTLNATGEHDWNEANEQGWKYCAVCGLAMQEVSSAAGWELVTDASTLKVGDKIIIVDKSGKYALSTNQKSSNREAVSFDINNISENVQIIVLKDGGSEGTFAFYVEGSTTGYLYAASSSANNLKTKSTLDDHGRWTITITDGVASIIAAKSTNRNVMQYNYNNGSPLINCYATASQTALAIYVEKSAQADGEEHYCSNNQKTIEAVAPTCTTAGKKAGVECSICHKILVEQEEVAPLQHDWADATCESPKTCKRDGCDATEGETVDHNYVEGYCKWCNTPQHVCSYDDVQVVEPTCQNGGYTESFCDCGKSVKTNEVGTVDHKDETGDYLCDYACGTKVLPADGEALTIEQAIAIAKLMGNTYTTQKYYITGVINEVYNTQYGNMYIEDENGNEICIYGLYDSTGKTGYNAMSYKPVVGDEITVYTVLGCYNGDPQGKSAWLDEVIAHEHDYKAVVTEPGCLTEGYTTHTCSICTVSYVDSKTEALGHTTENGECERCGQEISGDTPTVGTLAEFTFGANGSAKHVDGNDLGSSKSYTSGSYTLSLTGMSKVYGPAYDAKGNSCIKFGTSKLIGTMTFKVPDNVTEVVIYIAKYKSNSTKIDINGTSYTLTKNSDSGEYDVITIDTTTTKTITIKTVASTYRCMINTIVFNGYAK